MDEKTFTNKEILTEVRALLQSIDYQLEEPEIPKEFMGKPDFYGKRRKGEITHEIGGFVKEDVKEISRGVAQLWTIRRQLGEDMDYVIALPPLNEADLVDIMLADNNKLLKKIRRENFQIWLCNPKEKNICCVFGTPHDSLFAQHLKYKDLNMESHTFLREVKSE
ncbi:MAG: hypothetical protein SWO11_02770 [Thermodesulfobacteriota bacterium]|nr:hypothetical protein [Thermodesulfobacteriota bacterium]